MVKKVSNKRSDPTYQAKIFHVSFGGCQLSGTRKITR
jgi:hypothetical protein